MLKLKRLYISNAGRLVGKHAIDLTNRSNLIQVEGKNHNTGGSSGAGKTTAFHALEYLLGVNEVPATQLQSRRTKEALEVVGEFFDDHTNQEVVVSRSKGSFSLTINGEVVEGAVDKVEERLDRMIGIPKKICRRMFHKRQKEGGFFLNMTPKECHEFLSDVLDLNAWNKRTERAESDSKVWTERRKTLEQAQDSLSRLTAELSESVNSIVAPSPLPYDSSILPKLEDNVTVAEKAHQELVAAFNEANMAIAQPPKPIQEERLEEKQERTTLEAMKAQLVFEKRAADERLQKMLIELNTIDIALNSIHRAKEDLSRSAVELENLKNHIAHIKENKCPTCLQGWMTESKATAFDVAVGQARQLVMTIENHKNRISTEGKYQLDRQMLLERIEQEKQNNNFTELEIKIRQQEDKVQVVRDRYDQNQRASLEAYNASLALVRSQEEAVRTRYSALIENARNNVSMSRELLNKHRIELNAHQKAVENYESAKRSIISRLDKAKAEQKDVSLGLKTTTEKELVCAESAKVLKSFVNQMFQDALDQIAAKATEILARVPNTATASVSFEGFKATKSGAIKEEVTAYINMDGEINIPVKTVSGGERTSIDLAIDLGVIDMVEQRTGKGFDFFILDEPFDGLDSVCREHALEMLKLNTSNKRLFVIDHSNETKELVSDRIYVVRDGENSSICDTL